MIVIICVLTAAGVVMAGAIYLEYEVRTESRSLARQSPSRALPTSSCSSPSSWGWCDWCITVRSIPPQERPPIEVIIPAFNEELNIAHLLRTIDAAAARYQGPVRVIMCDDGSTDSTFRLRPMRSLRFQYATGEVIKGNHNGKSGALNLALSRCNADFVYRVDADCLVHQDCFLYSVPHFLADPKVGMLGAFTLPIEPYTTWIDRMRMFEMIVGFGMVRPASDVVDGIVCIPGTFTAFRRDAAMAIGGFVEGMYGEDLDFTLAIARIGYRAAIDTRVRSYEDVPNTQRQLRIQRTRWNRGATMAFARYTPAATGLAGCRFWFFMTRSVVQAVPRPSAHHGPGLRHHSGRAGPDQPPQSGASGSSSCCSGRSRRSSSSLDAPCTTGRRPTLGWLPLRYAFIMLKHYYGLEAFLGFNARPVVTDRVRESLRPAPRHRALQEVKVAES